MISNLDTYQAIERSETMKKGVFWIIDNNLCAFPFDQATEGVAKSGDTFNHKLLWKKVKPSKEKHPYNYYPRGRVEIDNKNRPIIYMGLDVDAKFIPEIIIEFEITATPVIHYDGSKHYKSLMYNA